MNLFVLAGWWEKIWINIFMTLCRWIYELITWLYEVYMAVAKVNLFSRDIFEKLTSRMYVVISVAMLFIFAYNIILMIVNPDDKKSTGQTTKLVKETVISFVMIILMPTIFNYMFVFQNNILDSNIIGTIILGGVGSSSADSTECAPDDYDCSCKFEDYQFDSKGIPSVKNEDIPTILGGNCELYKKLKPSTRGARMIPSLLLSAFYKPVNYTFQDCTAYVQKRLTIADDDEKKICSNYFFDVTLSKYRGDINPFLVDNYLKDRAAEADDVKKVDFNGLMAMLSGILAVYMFLCYAMEIGVRVAKLGVLQIISPIPVMMRIIPKQKEAMYDKWFSKLLDTYLDVFIRLAIIYFALFACSLVPDVLANLGAGIAASYSTTSGGVKGGIVITLATVIVILGILKFAQEAPALLKEFFGSSGKFALKSPAKQLSENKGLMRGLGAAGGLASGFAKNLNHGMRHGNKLKALGSAIAGGTSGMVRGGRAGAKSGTFKDLKTNTSRAIDDVMEARDAREKRRTYESYKRDKNGNIIYGTDGKPIVTAKGTLGYYKDKISDGWKNWISGESFASLKSKKEDLSNIQKLYAGAIEMAETKITEKPEAYKLDGKTFGDYKRASDGAKAAFEDFVSKQPEWEKKMAEKIRAERGTKLQTEAALMAERYKDSKEDRIKEIIESKKASITAEEIAEYKRISMADGAPVPTDAMAIEVLAKQRAEIVYKEEMETLASEKLAREAARVEKTRLEDNYRAASENVRIAKEAIADAVMKNPEADIEGGKIKVEGFRKLEIDEKTGLEIYRDATAMELDVSAQKVNGVAQKIAEANNEISKHSQSMQESTRAEVNNQRDNIRKVNGILKGEISDINEAMSKLSELKNSDKK